MDRPKRKSLLDRLKSMFPFGRSSYQVPKGYDPSLGRDTYQEADATDLLNPLNALSPLSPLNPLNPLYSHQGERNNSDELPENKDHGYVDITPSPPSIESSPSSYEGGSSVADSGGSSSDSGGFSSGGD